jgi:DNA polymerase delta subunit 2
VPSDLFAFNAATKKNFTKQYATLYFSRLTALKKTVLAVASAALPRYPQCARADGSAPKVCERILDMVAGEFCVVAGTLFKDMKLKPCILDEYARTSHGATTAAPSEAAAASTRYMSGDDTLVLEDEFGRVPLTVAAGAGAADVLPIAKMVTGMVISVLGREIAGGKFEVHAFFVPGMAPQKPLPLALQAKEARPPAYMLCVSGLQLGAPGQDPLPVQLLMDYVTGLLGSTTEQRASARIVRVLLAGNSLHRFEKRKGGVSAGGRGADDAEADEAMAPLRELDMLLTQLAAAVPVDILPGSTDPSNFTLPQQPLHKCLLPSASTYSTLGRLTNPAWTQLHDGLQCLVTAGQNVDDLGKYCEAPAPIDVRVQRTWHALFLRQYRDELMRGPSLTPLFFVCFVVSAQFLEQSLRWRVVAPTAPDTLGCYPYQEKDPFVLSEAPHLYVVGNQPAYATRLCQEQSGAGQQVRAVCVPTFATTGTAVLVDLNSPTLATQAISFKVQQ